MRINGCQIAHRFGEHRFNWHFIGDLRQRGRNERRQRRTVLQRAIDIRSPRAVWRLLRRQKSDGTSYGFIDLREERRLVLATRYAGSTESGCDKTDAAARKFATSNHGLLAFGQLGSQRNRSA